MALTPFTSVDLTDNIEKRLIRNKTGTIAKVGGQLNRHQGDPVGSDTTSAAGDIILDVSATYTHVRQWDGPFVADALATPWIASQHTQDFVNHGSVAGGPFTVGETITGGSSGGTGIVTTVGDGFLNYIDSNVGTPITTAEVITGGGSGATATTSSNAATATAVDTIAFRVFTASDGLALNAGAILFSYRAYGDLV